MWGWEYCNWKKCSGAIFQLESILVMYFFFLSFSFSWSRWPVHSSPLAMEAFSIPATDTDWPDRSYFAEPKDIEDVDGVLEGTIGRNKFGARRPHSPFAEF